MISSHPHSAPSALTMIYGFRVIDWLLAYCIISARDTTCASSFHTLDRHKRHMGAAAYRSVSSVLQKLAKADNAKNSLPMINTQRFRTAV